MSKKAVIWIIAVFAVVVGILAFKPFEFQHAAADGKSRATAQKYRDSQQALTSTYANEIFASEKRGVTPEQKASLVSNACSLLLFVDDPTWVLPAPEQECADYRIHEPDIMKVHGLWDDLMVAREHGFPATAERDKFCDGYRSLTVPTWLLKVFYDGTCHAAN